MPKSSNIVARFAFALASLIAASTFVAGRADAAVQQYSLDVACPACGTGPTFGTVTVTEIANDDLSVLVQLDPSVYFHRNQNDNQHALAFSLFGNPTVTISALSDARFSANGTQAPTSVSAPPFSSFEYFINFERGVRGPPTLLQTLSFNIGGATPLSLASLESHAVTCTDCIPTGLHQIFFAVDISNQRGSDTFTGNVGARIASGVPEPATWAMMLIGFAGLGLVSRRRNSLSASAA